MFKTSISNTSRLAGIIATTALTAGLAISGGGTANAAGPASGTGEVDASGGLSIRYAPTTSSKQVSALRDNARVALACKVRGTSVGNNDIWYKLNSRTKWISARFVRNVGRAPGWCADSNAVGENNQAIGLNLRAGPSTKDRVVGSLSANGRVKLICKVNGESIRGNKLWYQTTDRKWVTARYVDNVGRAPSYC